jgi:WD40 repeat protein
MDEISVKIDNETDNKTDNVKIDVIDKDKIDVTDEDTIDTNKPHKGQPITEVEVSPNEKYLVTYSRKDFSVVCWDITEGQLKPEFHIERAIVDVDVSNHQICVSDDKQIVYITIGNQLSE